jgi:DNA adenine methylase
MGNAVSKIASVVAGDQQEIRTEGDVSARPFVKWAGGKGQLLSELTKRLPRKFNRYCEPFVGGGALFFHLKPEVALLSDVNEELTLAYQVIRDDVESLIEELKKHRYEKEYFYSVREWDRREDYKQLSAVQKVGRFIFLNKTCFNGLHRVNSKGQFNVPFGEYTNPTIVDVENLRRCSRALAHTEIVLADYLSLEKQLGEGDFIYFDPPYAPLSATSSFTSYTVDGFDSNDQIALRDMCKRLDEKGVLFMLSNSSSMWIRDLYGDFCIHSVSASRAINSKASSRGCVEELIVTNYKSFRKD